MQEQENIHKLSHQRTRKRRTKEEIQKLIENWRISKLSQSEFCRQEGLCIQSFCGWVKQYKVNSKVKSPLSFVPMKISQCHQTGENQYIEIKFAKGLQCRFAMNSNIKQIAQITKELIRVIGD